MFTLQNLGEAEYVVALFMYMCLLGYPADKISILTTYNGQKHLIRDIINRRCGSNPLIGRPNKVILWILYVLLFIMLASGKICMYYELFILFYFVSLLSPFMLWENEIMGTINNSLAVLAEIVVGLLWTSVSTITLKIFVGDNQK